jgi:hypothetical protein
MSRNDRHSSLLAIQELLAGRNSRRPCRQGWLALAREAGSRSVWKLGWARVWKRTSVLAEEPADGRGRLEATSRSRWDLGTLRGYTGRCSCLRGRQGVALSRSLSAREGDARRVGIAGRGAGSLPVRNESLRAPQREEARPVLWQELPWARSDGDGCAGRAPLRDAPWLRDSAELPPTRHGVGARVCCGRGHVA